MKINPLDPFLKSCLSLPTGGCPFSYALRQLKSPLSNINRLAEQVSVSTGTFVILGVIPAMTREAWGWQ